MSSNNDASIGDAIKKFNIVPGCIIILMKVLYNHWDGFLMAGAFTLIFHYANSNFTQISLRKFTAKKQFEVLWILFYLIVSIAMLYYVYLPDKIYKGLFMMYTSFPTNSVWHLLWIVIITDFVLKLLCICIKCIVSLIPTYQNALWNKGSVFLVCEYVFQLYRMIVPMTPYVLFLTSVDPLHDSYWFNSCLVIFYVLVKGYYFYERVNEFLKELHTLDLKLDMCQIYTGDEVACAICHNRFIDPVVLPCGDVFCKNCLIGSLMRVSFCPLCDNVIYFKSNCWRNGQTQAFMQLY